MKTMNTFRMTVVFALLWCAGLQNAKAGNLLSKEDSLELVKMCQDYEAAKKKAYDRMNTQEALLDFSDSHYDKKKEEIEKHYEEELESLKNDFGASLAANPRFVKVTRLRNILMNYLDKRNADRRAREKTEKWQRGEYIDPETGIMMDEKVIFVAEWDGKLIKLIKDNPAFMDYPTNATHANGQIQQYLLYVQEDVELDSVDAALTRVAAPRNPIVTENNHYVTVMLANKGATPLTSATIEYAFNDNYHPAQSGTINWNGNLDPGKSVPVRLDSIDFYEGTTDLLCTVSVPGDTFHTANNELHYRFHRYFVVEATVADSFDVGINKWYVPAGYNNYTRNYFERGIPAKSHIVSAYSQPNALITSTTESVVTGVHGNRSVVYSPIINIQQIKVDTIKFLISKDMAEGAFMWMEYLNFEKKWVLLDHPSARWGAEDNPSWYDQQEGWTGSTNNGEYIPVSIPTTGTSGNFPQRLQFRFVGIALLRTYALQLDETNPIPACKLFYERRFPDTTPSTTCHQRSHRLSPKRLQLFKLLFSSYEHKQAPIPLSAETSMIISYFLRSVNTHLGEEYALCTFFAQSNANRSTSDQGSSAVAEARPGASRRMTATALP